MPPLDDPFLKADELIAEAAKRTPYIFIDFHAEATSEKLALGWYTDGRASAVVGTHTHVQTADNRILPKERHILLMGMTGPYDGILGWTERRLLSDSKRTFQSGLLSLKEKQRSAELSLTLTIKRKKP